MIPILDEANGDVKNYVNKNFTVCNASRCGLNYRAGRIYVNVVGGVIAVHKNNDHDLQYYGGFKCGNNDLEHRHELGDFVFYISGEQVTNAIDCFIESEFVRMTNLF